MYVCKGMKLAVNVTFQLPPIFNLYPCSPSLLSFPPVLCIIYNEHSVHIILIHVCHTKHLHTTATTALFWSSIHSFNNFYDIFWSPWYCSTCRFACFSVFASNYLWIFGPWYLCIRRIIVRWFIVLFWIWQGFSYLLEVEKLGKLQMYGRLSKRSTLNILFRALTIVPMRTS